MTQTLTINVPPIGDWVPANLMPGPLALSPVWGDLRADCRHCAVGIPVPAAAVYTTTASVAGKQVMVYMTAPPNGSNYNTPTQMMRRWENTRGTRLRKKPTFRPRLQFLRPR